MPAFNISKTDRRLQWNKSIRSLISLSISPAEPHTFHPRSDETRKEWHIINNAQAYNTHTRRRELKCCIGKTKTICPNKHESAAAASTKLCTRRRRSDYTGTKRGKTHTHRAREISPARCTFNCALSCTCVCALFSPGPRPNKLRGHARARSKPPLSYRMFNCFPPAPRPSCSARLEIVIDAAAARPPSQRGPH